LNSKTLWLNWDTAISIVGHDCKIKHFYEQLIKSADKPKCFLDVGANYGTHSILFLANDIRTISFEPNPSCLEYFHKMAELNNLSYEWNNKALSDKCEQVQLTFPEKDTWSGSISLDYKKDFSAK
jgi:hypothetical protein